MNRMLKSVPPAPFEWLMDGLPEDGLEEQAWLLAELADTPEAAGKKMAWQYERDCGPLDIYGPDAYFTCSGRVWMRAELAVYDHAGEERWVAQGFRAEELADKHDRLEELRFQRCAPDEDGAREWWVCDLVFEATE